MSGLFFRFNCIIILSLLTLSVSNECSSANFTPSKIAEPNIPLLQTFVTKFGAVPNDNKDDTAAIQMGLDAVASAGGGTLVFPQGIYDISIDSKMRRALTLHSKTRLFSDSSAPATLRLANNQIIYESIIASAAYSTRLDDVEFEGLVFDANSQNNAVKSPDETNGDLGNPTLRYVFRVFTGARVRVQNCTFINLDNGNTLSFNGDVMSDIVVENSKFLSVGNSQLDHDHSTIYTSAKRVRIANNTFIGLKGAGTLGARTAVETHGDDVAVIGNIITGYLQGANIVGRASDPSRQIYKSNKFNDVAVGMNIWLLDDNFLGSSPSFLSLDILDNKVIVDAESWWASRAMVIEAPAGIHFERSISKGMITSLAITGNILSFKSFDGVNGRSDQLSSGIALHGIEGKLGIGKLELFNNAITNSIGPCILSTAIVGADEASIVSENILRNCGRGKSLNGEGDILRSGMVINGSNKNLQIMNNTIVMNENSISTLNGIIIAAPCLSSCFIAGNKTAGIQQPVRIIGSGWKEKNF